MEAFRRRLMDKLPDFLNETNCVIDDEPLPGGEHDPGWDFNCSISMPDGMFDQSMQMGGSRCTIHESGEVHVCIMQRHGEGDPERLDSELLGKNQISMVRFWKHQILSAILVERSESVKFPWIPVNQNGNSLLSEGIRVIRCIGPRRHVEWPILYLTVVFHASWNWDL